MNLTKLPRAYREVLATFEALCRFGIDPAHIYFQAGPSFEPGKTVLRVVLAPSLTSDGRPFVIDAGLVSLTEGDRFEKKFAQVIEIVNTKAPAKRARVRRWREKIWEESMIGSNVVAFASLASAMLVRGIRSPELDLAVERARNTASGAAAN